MEGGDSGGRKELVEDYFHNPVANVIAVLLFYCVTPKHEPK